MLVSERPDPFRGTGAFRMLADEELSRTTLTFVKRAIAALRDILDIQPPYAFMLSLGHAAGAYIREVEEIHKLRDDPIQPPTIVVEDGQQSVSSLLQPALDVIWQSAGFDGAPEVK